MTPFEFGYLVGGHEKTAGGLWAGLNKGTAMAGKALTGINDASRSIVRGAGGVVRGAGQLTDSAGAVVRGLGVDAQRLGRHAIQPGPKGRVSLFGDLAGILGHSAHAAGNATRLTGHGVSWLGKRLDDLGQGIHYVGDAPMGIPTVAAGGLLAAAANGAPKLPLPSVHFQSPINVNVDYETRRPVQFRW
jgi:hypothetical protein